MSYLKSFYASLDFRIYLLRSFSVFFKGFELALLTTK